MNEQIDIKSKLDEIIQTEGAEFEFEMPGIEKEYAKLHSDSSSLAIKILSISGGILATFAFIGFLLIAGLYDSEQGLIVLGTIFIAGAILVNVKFNKLIIDTSSISAYAIGYCLLAGGLGMLRVDANIICLLFVIISLVVLIITQNYMLSFVSILIINGCFLFLIVYHDSINFIHLYNASVLLLMTLVYLHEAKIICNLRRFSKLYNPLRIGLTISILSGLVFVGKRGLLNNSDYFNWTSSIITIPLTIYVISIILKTIGIKDIKAKIGIYVLSVLFLVPTAYSPAISGSLLIILLAFLVNFKTGLYLGIISFIYFISQYYYDLNFTLLTKSIILFFSGLVFLLFFFLIHKKSVTNEKV